MWHAQNKVMGVAPGRHALRYAQGLATQFPTCSSYQAGCLSVGNAYQTAGGAERPRPPWGLASLLAPFRGANGKPGQPLRGAPADFREKFFGLSRIALQLGSTTPL